MIVIFLLDYCETLISVIIYSLSDFVSRRVQLCPCGPAIISPEMASFNLILISTIYLDGLTPSGAKIILYKKFLLKYLAYFENKRIL